MSGSLVDNRDDDTFEEAALAEAIRDGLHSGTVSPADVMRMLGEDLTDPELYPTSG